MIDLKTINIQVIKEFLSDETKRMYVILGGTAIIALLYAVVFIFPTFTSFSKVTTEVKEINEKMNFINQSIFKMAHRKELLEKLQLELDSYAGGLPNEKEISGFLENISIIAKTSGVKILAITPSGLKPLKIEDTGIYYYEMPISITAKSGYHELGRFISEIEQGKRFMTVEGLQIRDNKNTPRKHDVRLVLKAYVSAESAE